MRWDSQDHVCPETLGEYRDMSVSLFGIRSNSTLYLDEKIAQRGRDFVVVATHEDMMTMLRYMAKPVEDNP